MRLLLDTHALLWMLGDPGRLLPRAAQAIQSPDNIVLLSAASVWEIAIKQSLGKLRLPGPVETWLAPELAERDIHVLPVEFRHAAAVRSLPHHHGDPFDRLLVAQAGRDLTLVTHDRRFEDYGVSLIWT